MIDFDECNDRKHLVLVDKVRTEKKNIHSQNHDNNTEGMTLIWKEWHKVFFEKKNNDSSP